MNQNIHFLSNNDSKQPPYNVYYIFVSTCMWKLFVSVEKGNLNMAAEIGWWHWAINT